MDVKAQEAALRLGPDVVIATPGRLIDHLHNAPNFNLQSVEVLILDEADRWVMKVPVEAQMQTGYRRGLVGGRLREGVLRLGPDVVIETPRRLINHLHNAPNFNLQSIEVLILGITVHHRILSQNIF